jgi:hypothetical protein
MTERFAAIQERIQSVIGAQHSMPGCFVARATGLE